MYPAPSPSRPPQGLWATGVSALHCLIAACAISGAAPTAARADAWSEEKCRRYDKAFHEILDLVGRDGVTDHFIKGNEAFIAAGCSNGADVCPRSPEDFDLANKLTLAAMGFGTASTFLPFVCRADQSAR